MAKRARQFQWWVPLASLAALGLLEARQMTLPGQASGEAYLREMRGKASEYGPNIGTWMGVDVPLPTEALQLLGANVVISREYGNSMSNQSVGLMLIESSDTRDMTGHYPPNCYPGAGWLLQKKTAMTWNAGGVSIPGYEYEFKRDAGGRDENKTVRDFFILPNGNFYPEIGSFGRAAADFYLRPFGAAQVQVIYDREYLPEDRDKIFESLVGAHMGLIEALRRKDH